MNKIHFENLQETLYNETLENGLDVYILPKKGFSKTFVTFTTKYGSVDRTFIPHGKEEAVTVPDGIAHFLEHKMFEKEEGDIFQKFSVLGGSANAFTSFTRTAYLFSATDKVYDNTEVLLDFVQEPYFTEETVEKEKGIIGQEITMYDDLPDWRLYFGAIENLYHNHPVKIDIAGTIESIDKITAAHLYECYETFYHPSNMVLFVVGAVEPEEMMTFIKENQSKKTFDKPSEIVRNFPEEPNTAAIAERTLEMDVTKPKLSFGMKCTNTNISGKEMLTQELAVDLLLDILFGRSSSFFEESYEDGLIDESYSYSFSQEHGFGFAMIVSDTENPDALEAKIRKTIEDATTSWAVTEEELERVRKRKIGQFMRSLNSIEFIANQFTRYKFNEMDLFDVVPTLEKMTLTHLKDAFSTLSATEGHTVFKVIPAEQSNEAK
ncbi:EF-P 5-aminopentanol modification-associated protein YfmH [Sporosarcina pasteurii]|uniref:Protease 3 n=1 Tax=Sporosarcina pasteurii TaxID=1474 RepID=A0A380BIY8_SPOPA|nr:pitrilysin family protein [Sporosarcina pasteurii]MDS9470644.1 pitrilysin family protein [Sporosarcina pasteurii]QBQ05670.1 insulinase family protein [Sporosarcina pasteurii]SUJ01398.1 Protease 3 precursor [Sporosarcina pasteurii]